MASRRQKAAARRNIKKAQAALRRRGRRRGRRRRNAAESFDENARKPRRRRRRARRRVARARGRARRRSRVMHRRVKRAVRRRRRRYNNPAELAENRPRRRRRRSHRRRVHRRRRNPSLQANRRRSSRRRGRRGQTAAQRRASMRNLRKARSARRHGGRRGGRRNNPAETLYDNPSELSNYDDNPDFDDNPIDGLLSNRGPFGREALTSYFVAATGTGFGIIAADFLDRYVATMKPKDAGGATANHPWYGRNAAAAQRRRPDGIRLGAQALGALAAMGGAYLTRNMRIVPWLLGGAAVGFGANLFKMLWDWWIAPAIMTVDPAKPESFANRMYALEQKDVQDSIDNLFENWNTNSSFAGNQNAGDLTAGSIKSPLSEDQANSAYVLGRARQSNGHARTQQLAGQGNCVGRAAFTPTGRVGACASCGGVGGCYCGCPWMAANVPAGMDHCVVTWQAGMSLADIVTRTGVDLGSVIAINSRYGVNIDEAVGPAVGSQVYLPVAACAAMQSAAVPTGAMYGTPELVPTAVQPIVPLGPLSGVASPSSNDQDAGANARSLMSQHN